MFLSSRLVGEGSLLPVAHEFSHNLAQEGKYCGRLCTNITPYGSCFSGRILKDALFLFRLRTIPRAATKDRTRLALFFSAVCGDTRSDTLGVIICMTNSAMFCRWRYVSERAPFTDVIDPAHLQVVVTRGHVRCTLRFRREGNNTEAADAEVC